METSKNIVLITGGATGIGLALAERFLQKDNQVIIIGRREEKLNEARAKFPELHTKVCDISNRTERESLYSWVKTNFPSLNILVNNAGIQQRINLLQPAFDWEYYHKEIAINLEGPIHLSLLFIPLLIKQKNPLILNISSGLALRPGVWVPIYSATKAAIHSFTMSLRLQLENSGVHVVEVFPPAVNTDLGGVGMHTTGAPLTDFADSVFEKILQGDSEIGYGDAEKRLRATKAEIDDGTKQAWENFLKNNPDF